MSEKNSNKKEKRLSSFLPKNLLSELEEIPYTEQEKVIKFKNNFLKLWINQKDFNEINEIQIPNKNTIYYPSDNGNKIKPFDNTNSGFSSKCEEGKHIILNNDSLINPENFYNAPKFSGSRQNINNNIKLKNANIINFNESNLYNDNKNLFLVDDFNVNNNLIYNNDINTKNNNYFMQNNSISNYHNNTVNANYKDKFEDLNINPFNSFNLNINSPKNINESNSSINNLNSINQINFEKDEIFSQNDFADYISNLKVSLSKFLSTKKGINEIKNLINVNINKNIDILLHSLNKEGLTKLMKNKIGNYFIQDLIKDSNYEQVKFILILISSNFVEISENISGTYVIQKLLDKVDNIELRLIVLKSIENRELEMAFNSNATYVLQKIIDKIPDIERINLNELIMNNIILLSVNQESIFIVEKFIEKITINENKIRIKNIIFMNCLQLSNNPYGNYLIQFILKVWKNEDIKCIQNLIIENANFLVQQRYASNVIEKCIEIFGYEKRKKLIRNLCFKGNLLDIIKNQYGHYIINKTVNYMEDNVKEQIEKILINKMPQMSKKEKYKSKKFITLMKSNTNNKK